LALLFSSRSILIWSFLWFDVRLLLRKRSKQYWVPVYGQAEFASMARTRTPANIIGPQLRRLRNEAGWTQEEFAARCQLGGYDVSRGTISQIEARLRCVKDDEVALLAKILGVPHGQLFPKQKK
jgi:DNA-binding XRE family transcriptional regulator